MDEVSYRPLIVVTGPDEGGWPAWICTRIMVWLAGGRAIRICPCRPKLPPEFSGLILGGGADISPSRYGQELMPELKTEIKSRRENWGRFLFFLIIWIFRRLGSAKVFTTGIDEARDRLEWKVLHMAIKNKIPVLGICRGGQLINVYFGGSLFQSIQSFYTEKPALHTIRARKWIDIVPGSILARSLGVTRTRVNSLHRQSVKDLGKGILVTARERSGVVQGVENKDYPFVVGVQWHPEFLWLSRSQRRLFRHFIAKCKSWRIEDMHPAGPKFIKRTSKYLIGVEPNR